MNRRSFTASLAALFAAPAFPMSLKAAPAVSSVAASKYATAKLLVRAHNKCSPAMLERLMRVDKAVASEINSMLLDKGVISAAGPGGASIATNPLNVNCVPNEALKAANYPQKMLDAKRRLRDLKEKVDKFKAGADESEEIEQSESPEQATKANA